VIPEATAGTDRAVGTVRPRKSRTATATPAVPAGESSARRLPVLALVLALLCVFAAAGAGVLLWQRLNPAYVDSSVFAATRDGVRALYAYDYRDSEGSVRGKLDVLTGDLRDQYEEDLGQGGIIDTYEQVSATTSYEVLDVGLQQVDDAQDTATLVVFGQYVVTSVNSGDQPAPEGSECQVTPDGAQSCTQTVQVRVLKVDGDWKISELTLLTTS
jgi:co-chaperonin GroES (HSP10)